MKTVAVGQGFGYESSEFQVTCDAAYEAGLEYAKTNPNKLPMRTEINGCVRQIVGTSSTIALSFVRGWKAGKATK